MIRIGIPRALLYYQYYPAFKTFFEGLGAEVVVSPPTNQEMLTLGSARVVADTCLPVKVFLGHVLSLVEGCDWVFIPALRSIQRKVYNCSKFLGLPDMTRAVIPESPPILEIEIDISKGKRGLYQAIYKLGRQFTLNPFRIRRAAKAALGAYLDYRGLMCNYKLTPLQAIEMISTAPGVGFEAISPTQPRAGAVIALIGHPYLLYDEHVNHRLIHRLEEAGSRVVTPEMPSSDELQSAIEVLVGRAYWTYEGEVVGAGEHYLESGVDGVIGLMTFGCGPDSLMMDMVARRAAKLKATPFMSLTLEEHQAPAGILTRLEAFLDMIYRKKRKQVEACV